MRELPGGLWWHCHGAQANPGRERPGATAQGHALEISQIFIKTILFFEILVIFNYYA